MKFFILICLLFPTFIYGFDTGHHYDATRNGLELRNFTRTSDSIPIVQLCNYINDWDSLTYDLDMPNFNYYKQLALLLHFSNCFNSTMVRDYWIQLITNQYNTVHAILNNTIVQHLHTNATDSNTPTLDNNFLLLCTLGYSLHATQDFYAHSNYIQSLVNKNMINNNSSNLHFNNNGNETCYYTANVYNFINDTQNDYNLHTYYWPENDKDQAQPFWPNTTLMEHGYYLNGINKDSYGRMDWDMAYSSAFMATIDVIDTWKGWINNDTLWHILQTYNFTGSNATKNWGELDKGQEEEFEISNYVKVPGFDSSKDGHWKGPNSGQFVATVKDATQWIRDDWQWDSPFQRAFYDTDIGQRLTFGLNGTLPGVDSAFMIPNVTQEVIQAFNATKLGLVVNNPSDYVAITVRTWGAGKWKTTPSNSSDQEIDGWYAIVGIDGQEFREATQYQGWVQPFWTAMRFIPANQTQVVITYDLMNYANDNTISSLFTNNHDIEGVIHPGNSSEAAATAPQDVTIVIPTNTSSVVKQHVMKLIPVPNEDMLQQGLGTAALIRERFHLRGSRRFNSLNHRANDTDGYTYRDEINPDVLNRTVNGVVFVMDTKTQQIVSGLPWFYLHRTYLDVNHSLILQGINGTENVAQVNLTLTSRLMCNTNQRQIAGTGEEGPAPVAAATPDHWGAQPSGSDALGAGYTISQSWFVLIAVVLTSLVAQS